MIKNPTIGRAALLIFIIFFYLGVSTLQAQAVTPFQCNNLAYQSISNAGTTQLYSYNAQTGIRTAVGASVPLGYNGIGYNPKDNFIYGKVGAVANQIVKVDANGAYTIITVPNLTNMGSGGITPDGYYFVSSSTNYAYIDVDPSRSTYGQIVDPRSATYPYPLMASPYLITYASGTGVNSISTADLAYNNADGFFYGLGTVGSGQQFRIIQVNPKTATATALTPAVTGGGIQGETEGYGAAFVDAANNFYVFANAQGRFYKVDIATRTATLVSTFPAATTNDGTICPTALFQSVTLSGNVYNDNNGTTGGADGNPYAGATVTLYASDGTTLLTTTTTDANGYYFFNLTASGSYVVKLTLPSGGFVNVSSSDATPTDGSISATVTTTNVTGVNFGINQPPVAVNDVQCQSASGATNIAVLSNDSDPNSGTINPATVVLSAGTVAGQGTWSVSPSGVVTFTPQAGFTGVPTPITYTVKDNAGLTSNSATITLQAAVVANPNTRSVNEDASLLVGTSNVGSANNLLTNDTGAGIAITGYTVAGQVGTPVLGTPFTVTGTRPNGTTGTIGTITINANGSYAYTPGSPLSNFNGAFPTITYTISGTTCGTASSTLNITVVPVEDCPALGSVAKSASEDAVLSWSGISFTDADGSSGTGYTITLELTNPNSVPDPGFFTATSSGGVTVTGSGTNLLTMQGNYTDLNAYLANAATRPTYTPPVDYNTTCGTLGQARTSIYQTGTASPAPGGTTCDTRLDNFAINAAIDTFNYNVNACQDTNKPFNVLTGTGTVSGTPSNFETPLANVSITAINGTAITNPIAIAGGQLNVSSNGDITFTPTAGFTGTATFTYTAQPGTAGCAETRTVTITVNAAPTITGTTNVNVGATTQLTGSGTAATTNPWISSNTTVATVSNTGLVTGVSAGTVTITYTNSNGCTSITEITVVQDFCYKNPAVTGTVLDANVGISALRSDNSDNWPQIRKGTWLVLESKTKGFVVNRVPTTAELDAIADPVEGMMIYDEEADCLKIFSSKDNGNTFAWFCLIQGCPDN